MFEWIVGFSIQSVLAVAIVAPVWLLLVRTLDVLPQSLSLSAKLKAIFFPFSIGYFIYSPSETAWKKLYRKSLNVFAVLAAVALIFLSVSSR